MVRRSAVLVWRVWREGRGRFGGWGNERRSAERRSGSSRRTNGSERGRVDRGEKKEVVRDVSRRVSCVR